MAWRLVAGAVLAFAPVTVAPARTAEPHALAIGRDCAERVVDAQLASLRDRGITGTGLAGGAVLLGQGAEATRRCVEAAGLRCRTEVIEAAGATADVEACGRPGTPLVTYPGIEFLRALSRRRSA